MHPIDAVDLRFDEGSLATLEVVLALIMAGVALDLSVDDFRRVLARPVAPAVGLVCQFFLLPAGTFLLTLVLPVPPSVKLGLVLVAACPGGNISNFMTHLAGGRTETSVGMTAVSTVAALVMTPFNLSFWGGMSATTAPLLQEVALDPLRLARTVGTLLVVPLGVGMAVAAWLPGVAARLRTPMKWASVAFFVVFVGVAFAKNFDHFLGHIATVAGPVALVNAFALLLGWSAAATLRLDVPDRRAVAIEVGIQNSGLGLLVVFAAFAGLGGMAVTAGWWSIWHIVTGLGVAGWWRWRDGRA
ncbi:MAG: bile acid:sodium symporter family protein [Alphaproteobacteria bacterium]|nr:bile acid:sodium symporter family protein [Alphaproteobacteria bacterium]